MRLLLLMAAIFTSLASVQAGDRKTETVIVVTLDGMRWQEIFRGPEPAAFAFEEEFDRKGYRMQLERKYGSLDLEARRRTLAPFIWNVIGEEGVLLGNLDRDSRGTLHNDHHNSYPGYSEMLTGVIEPRIEGNKKVHNPNNNVAEFLNNMPAYKGRTAAFGSWLTFHWIYNEDRSGVPVTAGAQEEYIQPDSALVDEIKRIEQQLPYEKDTTRYDAFTMAYARAALDQQKMAYVGIHFDETDRFAHAGKYDQYLMAMERQDRMIGELWSWLQSDERYAGKTTLLITVDHGRGDLSADDPTGWHGHGGRPGDDAVWLAAIGPDTPATGEAGEGATFDLAQVAATVAALMGEEFVSSHESLVAAPPISQVIAGK